MRIARAGTVIFITAVILAGTPALADGGQAVSLTPLPPPGGESHHESVVLAVRLDSADGAAGGLPVSFYIVTAVFGERLMKVGDGISDASGIVSVIYRPTWTGEHVVVAHFSGAHGYGPADTSFRFDAKVAASAYHPAEFGLAPVRSALPLAVGAAVLVIWGVLGFALVSTAMGIRSAARAAPAAAMLPSAFSAYIPPPMPAPPERTRLLAVLVAVLVVAAGLPLIWLTLRVADESGEQVVPAPTAAPGGHLPPVYSDPLPFTLVRTVQTLVFDDNGQPAPGSIALPTDLGIAAGRVRILDSANGRIVTVAPDGSLIPIQQGRGIDGTTVRGTAALASLGERLFVVSATGDRIVVIDESGLIEGSLLLTLPPGAVPAAIAGIAVSSEGRIWLSDAANHRVILLNGRGEFQLVLGEGVPSSADDGFNSPGGLAVDHDGNLYVSDTANRVVKKYSPLGVFLLAMGEHRLEGPRGLTIGDDGRIYVADATARRVHVIAPDGSYLGAVIEEAFQEPRAVRTFGGSLYVLDSLAGMLVLQPEEEAVHP
jgi:sugar lactone lactonase YvrE